MIGYDPVLAGIGVLVPLVAAVALWRFVRRRRRVAEALGDAALVRLLAGEDLRAVPRVRVFLLLGAAVALGVAVADPRWGAPRGPVEVQGGTVALVLDASASMLTRDVAPNRLERQRAAARALARGLRGSAVGVVAFAGRAYALSPPTVDPGALELYLGALDPEMVTQTGSSLAAAVRQGLGLLVGAGDEDAPGALVLVTDGDVVEDPAEIDAAVDIARRAGIPVHVLGVGTARGAPVPDVDLRTGRERGFKREPGGELALSRLNEPLLRRIAEATGGEYADLARPEAVDDVLAALLGEGAGGGGRAGGGVERPARYAWFAAAALALLLGEGVASGLSPRREP